MAKKKQNFHESFVEYDHVEGPSDRKFGYTVGGILIAIGILKIILIHFSALAAIFLLIGGMLTMGALVKPDVLAPLNKAWMKLAEVMFVVVNPVIMFLMYVLCFVPVGIIMKIVGYDPMKKKFDKDATTYWIERTDEETLPNPMKYQF